VSRGVTASSAPVHIGIIERPDDELNMSNLGLRLDEGRELLRRIQEAAVSTQAASWLAGRSICESCCLPLAHKDSATIVCRTAFGKVRLDSPRYFYCCCRTPPFCLLQVEWAAQWPYRTAVKLLGQVPFR
jgi:hypothetical protein